MSSSGSSVLAPTSVAANATAGIPIQPMDGPERIVLWRHGQTDENAAGRIQGQRDIPMNATGRQQALHASRVIARQLHAAGYEPQNITIVTSPLVRAVETGQALSHELGIDTKADEALIERAYGKWEGLTRAQILALDARAMQEWEEGGTPEGFGLESKLACGERVAAGIRAAAQTLHGGVLVVVAHGAALQCGLCVLLGLNPEEFSGLRGLDNCHWATLLRARGRRLSWRIATYNEWYDEV
ncbi:MAG: histidine phosphatase family protein [Actinomycetaceae bacterium]|nr:histidine phosphatase family protein [Actinomycetaceae bacterium]